MENQETYLNTDAWSSSFVESNLRLWESILDARDILCLPARTTVFSQGDLAEYIFVMQRGRVVLSVSSSDGGEKVLMYAGVGCIIGEQALINQMEYSYQAVTLEESCFYRISAALFRKYLTSNTDVAMAFIFNLLNKDQSLMAHIADLSFKSAKHRLIRELMFCAKTCGKKRKDGILIQRVFSQEDLGKRILASRVTVNKLIQELERQGSFYIMKEGDWCWTICIGCKLFWRTATNDCGEKVGAYSYEKICFEANPYDDPNPPGGSVHYLCAD